MRAVALVEPGIIEVVERPDPVLAAPGDAIIEISASGVCGSDLHMFHGRVPGGCPALLGHEYVGTVVAVGPGVSRVAVGNRVVGGFATACGQCRACTEGLYQHCVHGRMFGLGPRDRALAGTQAELALIPNADVTLRPIPDGLDDRDAVFAGDALATAFHAIAQSGMRPGDSCGVIGLGPIGLCAVMAAAASGAAKVVAFDRVDERLAMAAALGAEAVDVGGAEFAERARELTAAGALQVVIEAVGSSRTLASACELAAPGGTIAIVGMFGAPAGVPMDIVFRKGLTISAGVANVPAHIDRVLELLAAGRLEPRCLVTHELSLDAAPEAYRAFDRQEAIKAVLRP